MESFILFLIGSKIQEGDQSGMTAWSLDSAIADAPTSTAIAPERSPTEAPSRVQMRWMHGPIHILSNASGVVPVSFLLPECAIRVCVIRAAYLSAPLII